MESIATGIFAGAATLAVGHLVNAGFGYWRDGALRRREVAAIASALYGEIVIMRQSAARLANFVSFRVERGEENFDKHFREMVEIPTPKLFPALASKVGMLPSEIALEVVQFYARIDDAKAWLPRLEDDPERKYSYSAASVLRPAIDAVRNVEPTLGKIEKLAGIKPASHGLDIDRALEILGFEEEIAELHGS